ncbi:unnamed protein product [Cuscuta campestris]|uniref:Helitron helicase-like domain-containing protein n=1 Tax=Cuscuta campestris TaxID=132261 RepID=A0A484M2D1_9ASTE|nr:unnamed protein product [Cuscuta campestris]
MTTKPIKTNNRRIIIRKHPANSRKRDKLVQQHRAYCYIPVTGGARLRVLWSATLKDMNTTDEFSVILKTNPSLDQRVCNMPTTSQVAAIWVEEDANGVSENRHIRVYAKGGRSQTIQYYYSCYDPLQYPLLFPYGEMGWHEGIEKVCRNLSTVTNKASININITSTNIGSLTDLIEAEEDQFNNGQEKKNTVSCREYYAYKLQMRPNNESFLLHTGRLLQQFVVDMYVKLETQRLDYFRNKKKNKRTSTLNDVVESIEMGLEFGEELGKRVVLPSVKYLYKYIYKGHDRIGFNMQQPENEVIDEITNFQKGRWVSPPEAMWRIYGFTMSEIKPAVIHLSVHLPNH